MQPMTRSPDTVIARRLPAALIGVLVVLAAGAAIGATPKPKPSPLIGIWRWSAPDGCVETYQFRSDGTTHASSGEEVIEGRYRISATPTGSGAFQLTQRIVKTNGKPDCGGQVGRVGPEFTSFVYFEPSGARMFVCLDPRGARCIGPLGRLDGDII